MHMALTWGHSAQKKNPVLISTKSSTVLGFYLPYSLISVVYTEPVLLNHFLVLLQGLLKDAIINLRKHTIWRDCGSVECKMQQGVSGFNLSFEKIKREWSNYLCTEEKWKRALNKFPQKSQAQKDMLLFRLPMKIS